MDDLEITACRFVVGDLPSEDLPGIATDALVHQVDSPSLRELAGLNPGEVREAADLLREAADLLLAALDELGLKVQTRDQALWRFVRQVASRVVSGELPPDQGARWIWSQAAHEVEEEGDLRIFIGLASEREDHPDASKAIDAQIIEAAHELLARAEPRRWLRLQARRGQLPLSRSKSHGLEPVTPSDLGLDPSLAEAIALWASDYDATFAADAAGSGFDSEGEAEDFVERGRSLAAELQRELGDSWRVEFYPEPTRPPGVRLRARARSRWWQRLRSSGDR